MDIQYVGEHLLPGRVGNFFVVLAFAASLFATIAYFFAVNKKDESWKKMARGAFWIQAISVVGIVVSLAYIIGNHLFEYHYAWAHSSRELPTKYVISCFWEGQEGSFLLWAFWQMVLGIVLIFTAKKWESSVMAVVCLSQVFILSMLLGVDVFGQSIGSSPFILLREALEGPIFQRPDYLALIHDGNGLNPLLQNYWMVIHPPTLFLGFASMVVPFAFAIAGMWERRYEEWIRPALPWALFAVMVLGGGIIMGSFWAYEALNFGGFWAWDPVENASLIPWLTLIAAVHVMLAYRHTGHSYFTALFLVFISFVMVLYASFLTRSGILGETSVHAFTDLGMSGQLVLYIIAFLVLGVTLMVRHWKNFPITKKDEATYSREFWLFIGAIILSISCFQIVVTTSTPVINALFGTKLAPPTNVIEHYNKWQIPLAILVGLISAFAQFLKYKDTNRTKFYISLAASAIVSLALTLVIAYYGEFYQNPAFVLLIFASVFTILANGRILMDALKGKMKLAGSAVAHIGFGLILIGALIAASKNEVISINTSGYSYGKEFNEKNTRENILLWKDEPTKMMDYMVTYLGDSTVKPNTYYKVHYQKIDPNSGSVTDDFILYPNAQVNPKMGLIASPDTRHNLLHDIYTHVSSVPVKEEEPHEHEPHEGHTEDEEYTKTQNYSVRIGDTISFENGVIILEGLNQQVKVKDISLGKDDLAVGAKLRIISEEKVYESEPVYIIRNGLQFDLPKKVDEIGAKFRFTKIDPREGTIELVFLQKPPKQRDYIIMKAIVFPYINLLWGGTIIMVIGFLMSIWKRVKEVKRANA